MIIDLHLQLDVEEYSLQEVFPLTVTFATDTAGDRDFA
jgi:hypothetical protein